MCTKTIHKVFIIFCLKALDTFTVVVDFFPCCFTKNWKKIRRNKKVIVRLYLLAPSSLYLSLFPVSFCHIAAYNALKLYNRFTVDQKRCWQENKSSQIPVVYSSYLTSCGLVTIPLAQRGLHSTKHGVIGPAMETLCTLTPEEIGSLVAENLSGCLCGFAA